MRAEGELEEEEVEEVESENLECELMMYPNESVRPPDARLREDQQHIARVNQRSVGTAATYLSFRVEQHLSVMPGQVLAVPVGSLGARLGPASTIQVRAFDTFTWSV